MKRYFSFLLVFTNILLADVPVAHTGHVSVDGTPYWGEANFKFSIVDSDSNVLWNHDGSSTTIPTNEIKLNVENGFYSLHLGDTSISGMKELNADSLSSVQKAFLRVWFDQGTGNFQRVGVDLALGAAPFALVSEISRSGGSSFESRIAALEKIVSNIPATAIDPVLLAEVGYKKFPSRILNGLNFPNLNLDQVDFRSAMVNSSNLYQSSMKNSVFQSSTLNDSNFSEAVITTSNFTSSKFDSMNLINTDLSGSTFAHNESNSSDFSQSNMSLCDLNDAKLTDCNFSSVNLQGASLQTAVFKNCNLSNANLTNLDGQSADFSDSNLTNATISGNLKYSKFNNCILSGSDFSSSDLSDADFTGAIGFDPNSYSNVIYSNTTLPDGSKRKN